MKKRIFAFIIFVLILGSCFGSAVGAESAPDLVVDAADILTDSEEKELETLLEDIRTKHGIDVVVLTLESLPAGKSAMATADDYYDYNGYGDNGMLLLLAMESRDWWFSTCGTCISKMNVEATDALEDRIISKFSDGDYADGFETYAKFIDKYYESGKIPKAPFNFVNWIIIALVVGLVTGLLVTSSMKSKLVSVKLQRDAHGYAVGGSMALEQSTERFLYSTITKTPKANSNSSGRSGGGSHRSSSGRSHGGRGGKF